MTLLCISRQNYEISRGFATCECLKIRARLKIIVKHAPKMLSKLRENPAETVEPCVVVLGSPAGCDLHPGDKSGIFISEIET